MAMTEADKLTRREGIAATDAAPIAGLSPWKSAAEVWLEKKHPESVPNKKSKFLDWGHKLEPLIAEEYALKTKQIVDLSPIVRNKRLPWLMCSPDRLIRGKRKGVECKTASGMHSHEWGPEGTDLVPSHYLVQVAHSMMVLDVEEWDLAVLIGGNDFRIYHLHRDMELMKALFQQENEFYKRFIIGSETPEFDWGKGIMDFVLRKYPKHTKDKEFNVDENGDDVIKDALSDLIAARHSIAKFEETEAKQKTLTQAYMRDCESLVWKDKKLKITWRNMRDRVSVDWLGIFQEMHQHINLPSTTKREIVQRHIEIKPGGRQMRIYDKSQAKKEGGE